MSAWKLSFPSIRIPSFFGKPKRPAGGAADYGHKNGVGGDRYMELGEIDRGSFGKVCRCEHRGTGEIFAIKQVRQSQLDPRQQDALRAEIRILVKLKAQYKGGRVPNVVRYIEHYDNFLSCESEPTTNIVMELCESNLLELLQRQRGCPMNPKTVLELMRQLKNGLQILRKESIIHRDLKPANLLLTCISPIGQLKIADFGCSRELAAGNFAGTYAGTVDYMAPELFEEEKHDERVDLWSVGCIMAEMLSGVHPFRAQGRLAVHRSLIKERTSPVFEVPPGWSVAAGV